jgi:hypothetical protein
MNNLKLLTFAFFFLSTLVLAQERKCTVYWGEARCSISSNEGIFDLYATKTVAEDNAQISPKVIAFNETWDFHCEALLPKNKVVYSNTICPDPLKVRINGIGVFTSKIEQEAFSYTGYSRNLYASTKLHLSTILYGFDKKEVHYKIISGSSGTGTNGTWVKLPKMSGDYRHIDLDLGPVINSSVTGILPSSPYQAPSPMINFSKVHFRIRPDPDVSSDPWFYTSGVWLYYDNSVPVSTNLTLGFPPSGSSTEYGPSYGGTGGNEYEQVCNMGSMSGIRLRWGSKIDAVGISCYKDTPTNIVMYGGTGGAGAYFNCPSSTPFVKGIRGRAYAEIDRLGLLCTDSTKISATPTQELGGNGGVAFSYTCASGFTVKGLHGKSGSRVDRIGAICSNRPEDSPEL